MDAVRFAEDVLPGLRSNPAFEIQADGHQPEFREVVGKPEIQFTTAPAPSGRTDWLDLEVAVTIGGRQVGLATVIEAIATGQDKILLHQTERKGTYLYVSVDHPELDALARMLEDARAMSDRRRDVATMSVATQAFDLWDELDEIGVVDVQAARWVAMARRLVGSEGVPDVAAPTGLKATLRPYQQHGFSWLAFLAEHALGGILADDMGLGKTLQALALILLRAPRSRVWRALTDATEFVEVFNNSTAANSRSRFIPATARTRSFRQTAAAVLQTEIITKKKGSRGI